MDSAGRRDRNAAQRDLKVLQGCCVVFPLPLFCQWCGTLQKSGRRVTLLWATHRCSSINFHFVFHFVHGWGLNCSSERYLLWKDALHVQYIYIYKVRFVYRCPKFYINCRIIKRIIHNNTFFRLLKKAALLTFSVQQ